jgi:hypothetical protein
VFDILDVDEDKLLSFEEFHSGMSRLSQATITPNHYREVKEVTLDEWETLTR